MVLPALAAPSVILLVATYTDVRWRKIYNTWIIASIFLALLSSFGFYGWEGIRLGVLASGLALVMTIPLVLIGGLGAGDMKLLFALGLSTTYQALFSIIVFSFLWAAVIGIMMSAKNGTTKVLFENTFKILKNDPALQKEKTHQMPFSVAILLGWITYLVIAFSQGHLS